MFSVKVNATSANLSVGFDVLGLALDIKNVFTFEKSDDFLFTGFEKKYCNKDHNLVYDSYIKVFEKLNIKPIPVKGKLSLWNFDGELEYFEPLDPDDDELDKRYHEVWEPLEYWCATGTDLLARQVWRKKG